MCKRSTKRSTRARSVPAGGGRGRRRARIAWRAREEGARETRTSFCAMGKQRAASRSIAATASCSLYGSSSLPGGRSDEGGGVEAVGVMEEEQMLVGVEEEVVLGGGSLPGTVLQPPRLLAVGGPPHAVGHHAAAVPRDHRRAVLHLIRAAAVALVAPPLAVVNAARGVRLDAVPLALALFPLALVDVAVLVPATARPHDAQRCDTRTAGLDRAPRVNLPRPSGSSARHSPSYL